MTNARSAGTANPGRPAEAPRPLSASPAELAPRPCLQGSARSGSRKREHSAKLREASGLTWQDDIGAASEVNFLHDENAPCVIFTDIPGTIPGQQGFHQLLWRQAQEHDARLSHRPLQDRAE